MLDSDTKNPHSVGLAAVLAVMPVSAFIIDVILYDFGKNRKKNQNII
jgi:hypothetical protein